MQRFDPRPAQERAVQHILDNPATGLFWRMGSGKTVTVLTALDDLLMAGDHGEVVLVVAPKRVAEDTWVREAAKWAHTRHLEVRLCLGTSTARKRVLGRLKGLIVINVENLPWLVKLYGERWPFRVVILDEFSGYKDASTQRVRALRSVRKSIQKLIGLTGSPASNGYGNLYSQLLLLDGGARLGKTLTQFRELWMEPDARSRERVFTWRLRAGKKEEVDRAISDICLVSTPVDLPPVFENQIVVVLTPEEQGIYDRLERDSLVEFIDGDVEAVNSAVLGQKLLQLTSGAVYNEHGAVQRVHEAKLDALARVLDEAGGPVLVFYQFQHELDRMRERFPHLRTVEGPQDVADWNAGGIELLAMHPGGAYGLNMQDGGSTIVWFTLTRSLEHFEQANARLVRPGQMQSVVIHYLLVPASMDYVALADLRRKDVTQESLFTALRRLALARHG